MQFIFKKRSRLSSSHITLIEHDEEFESLRKTILSSNKDKATQKQLAAKKKIISKLEDNLYVIIFDGDTKAAASNNLAHIVNVLVPMLRPQDIVICKIESPGGLVPHYGLAASQLARLRDFCQLIVSIDLIAASGGYMMACVAHKIIAAPFSIVGSIGVVAQLPNFNKFMKNKDIEFEEHTAGGSKRSLTMFGENTPDKRQRFTEKLDVTHRLFQEHIKKYRPQVDLEHVSDGNYFYANESVFLLDNHLVDEVTTFDEFIDRHRGQYKLWRFDVQKKTSWWQKIFQALEILK